MAKNPDNPRKHSSQEYEMIRKLVTDAYFRGKEDRSLYRTQAQLATDFNVSVHAVQTWCQRRNKVKPEDLETWHKMKPPPGQARKMSSAQEQELFIELKYGAEYHGFEDDFWTHKRISKFILEKFKIVYSGRQISRILARNNWTRQRPQLQSGAQRKELKERRYGEELPDFKKSGVRRANHQSSR